MKIYMRGFFIIAALAAVLFAACSGGVEQGQQPRLEIGITGAPPVEEGTLPEGALPEGAETTVAEESARAPAPPFNIVATPGDAQVTVSWAPAPGADYYNVYWAQSAGVTTNSTKVPKITGPFVHDNLVNGTKYFYIVTAQNASGESKPSTEVSAVPAGQQQQINVPAAPLNLKAQAGDSQVMLSWDQVTGADSYNVYWDTQPNVTINSTKIAQAALPYLHGSLANGTAYYYIVTAQNSAGESVPSAEVTATPVQPGQPCVTPAKPINLLAEAGNQQVTLKWDVVPDATEYNIYWGNATGVTPVNNMNTKTTVANLSFVHSGLSNEKPYYYVVTAVAKQQSCEGPASDEASATPSLLGELVSDISAVNSSLLGSSVAISGVRGIAGSPLNQPGRVYMLELQNGTWQATMLNRITPGQSGDRFGTSVAIDGDYAIVGAPVTNVNNIIEAGAAYIFHFENGKWVEKQQLKAQTPGAGDWFGSSVAISGKYAIVGADPASPSNSGMAHIFRLDQNGWILVKKLTPPAGQQSENFGYSVAISGDNAIIGSPGRDVSGKVDAGAAFIAHRDNFGWDLDGVIHYASDLQEKALFGSSVAIDGDDVFIGAPHVKANNVVNSGQVYAYHYNGNAWNETQKIVTSNPHPWYELGAAVSLKGPYAIIGQPMKPYSSGGAAFILHRGNQGWEFTGPKLEEPAGTGHVDDNFGGAVGISESYAIVGASKVGNNDAGKVFIFR